MTINENVIKGKWLEMKGDIQKAWGKLTDDELDKTKGDPKVIGGLIQQRYGETQELYGKKLSDIARRFEEKREETAEKVKDALKK
jgi:uncharacterized protein YjbJ (UPF0337 family)